MNTSNENFKRIATSNLSVSEKTEQLNAILIARRENRAEEERIQKRIEAKNRRLNVLSSFSKKELQEECRRNSVRENGCKAILETRIINAEFK